MWNENVELRVKQRGRDVDIDVTVGAVIVLRETQL